MSQSDMNDITNLKKQVDYLVAHLLDFFRDPKHEQKFMYAAKIAARQAVLSSGSTANFEKRFLYFSNKLKNNISPQSLRYFAEECSEAVASGSMLRENKPKDPNSLKMMHKRAQKDLSLSLAAGHSQGAALNRAAYELLKQKRETDRANRIANIAKSHPLKDTLLACNIGQRPLPKEDIKQHFLGLKKTAQGDKSGVLFGLLEKAQAFSAANLHRLLGDDLFFLCRPLGFLDQNSSTLIAEVPTNAHLHALTYRKLEILRALKKDLAFRHVRTIRFKVTHTMF
jgi:hypothetical protein